jgi:NAD(P)-dependent dehydrogenase (short-subunit alcohol dehydrogenase family)
VRRFDGKRAVVADGATGYGRGTALRLAAEGAHVFVLDPEADALAGLADEVAAFSFKAKAAVPR